MSAFLAALRSGRVLLMDGAMGTELQRAGLAAGEYGEGWNLAHPDRVGVIHRSYVAAGAEVLLTNTFQANPLVGARHGLTVTQVSDIHNTGRRLALEAAADRYVLADIGPPFDPNSAREFADWGVLKQTVMSAGTLDPVRETGRLSGLLLETFSTSRGCLAARHAARFNWFPVLLSLAYLRRGHKLTTSCGHPPEWFAERAKGYGVAALGVNCGRDMGMDEIIEIIRRYRAVTDLPLFARPNAGTPTKKGKRWVYPHTPEAMAARLPELLAAGVSMVGGCCGTTPEHIAAFRPIVTAWNANRGN